MQTRRLIALVLVVVLALVGAGIYLGGAYNSGSPTVPEGNPSPKEETLAPPLFEDVTGKSGIVFTYRNGENLVDADGMARCLR